MPCSSGTRGSARCTSQLVLRPTRSHWPVTARRETLRPALVVMRIFIALPVDEDRDHVHRERGEQHEGERHVEVEPEVEYRLVLEVAARALEHLVLLQEERVDVLVEARAVAREAPREDRPHLDRVGRGTAPVDARHEAT